MNAEERFELLESQITEEKKTVDFDTREFTIEFLVQKYTSKMETNENDIFVPDYQREFVWDTERQSKLIESITLGLPIPIIFLAEDHNGRLEIVDGSQRIRTIAAFITGELVLEGLDKLTRMNGLRFADLPDSRRRKINNTPIRMIVLSDAANEDVRNDLFERINRGSDLLRNMEKRKGIYHGPFNDFIYKVCAVNPDLAPLTPLGKAVQKRQEHEELVLRFFAISHHYPQFSRYNQGVSDTLDAFMNDQNSKFDAVAQANMLHDFERMLAYVKASFPHGFARGDKKVVSRPLFEAISVGVHLALKERPDLPVRKIDIERMLLNKNFFEASSGARQTHDPRKILARINYVKDELLRG